MGSPPSIPGRLLISSALLLPLAAPTAGQNWHAVLLHPEGAIRSNARAGAGTLQGGSLDGLGGLTRPVVWNSSAAGWVDLSPSPTTDVGTVLGMSEGSQVGALNGRASLWSGTAASLINLNPSGTGVGTSSRALATAGGLQAGEVTPFGQERRAALWSGSVQSYIDLHPAGAVRSSASATDGVRQGGFADFFIPGLGTVQHAALWNRSASSFVDLNPGPFYSSVVLAMAPGQQVGWAASGATGGGQRAAMWSGTAASWVSLHPFETGGSMLYGTNGLAQVGFSHVPGFSLGHAGVWFGTASSFVDLHTFLPPRFDSSGAYSVSLVGDQLYIAGAAYDPELGRGEAVLWVGTVPSPAGGLVLLGLAATRRRRGRS